jgi:cell division protein FtsI/penicillin-binding protein 2
MFLTAAVSQAKLQTFDQQHTISLANNTNRFELVAADPATRGEIISSDGRTLARDERVFDLNVNFKECPHAEGFWLDLSAACLIPASDFSELALEGVESRTWPQAVDESARSAVDQVRRRWHTKAVSVMSSGYREYPLGEEAACLVGLIRRKAEEVRPGDRLYEAALREYGPPQKGRPAVADLLTGIEEAQDSVLRGRDGQQVGVTDRGGHFLPMRTRDNGVARVDGRSVTVTIDTGLQALAAATIKKAVEDSKASCGVAVIEDPSNGDLLAVANWPGFAPYTPEGTYASMGAHGGLNQAYMSCLEPGSMFKILTLAKALDEHVVKMSDTFYCPGEKVVVPGAKPIKCDLHASGRAHGLIDPEMAIARSCNIWAATWAYRIGYDKFFAYLNDLGLLDRPGIGLPGETRGLFNRRDPAKKLQIANVGFGQSINCTPVALASAFSTLANKGVRVKPRIVEQIGEKSVPVAPGQRILSEDSCQNVIKGMVAAVENPHGTAYALRIPGYHLAGKTGTAQKIGKAAGGHVSNFVGFVPAENPRAVVLVMIDDPKTKYYGAEVAGPVFKQLAQEIIRRYRIQPHADSAKS